VFIKVPEHHPAKRIKLTSVELSPRKRDLLRINREILINILDAVNLLDGLYMKGVIDVHQKEVISTLYSDSEKNKALFSVLEHGSSDSYNKLVKCLREVGKGDVADILQHGGGRPAYVYNRSRKIEISRAPTKTKWRGPAYSQLK